eukprot:CAMPEP_0169106238 /NCGR_PEP_ID=MMETSP1015-20121227/24229_1 /TAXON_ID=342587 /ORGANISM="Karlodinium micrum, Strain CCMP2283" /LENGTH=325 /DNA_ID=CAMNT_0009167663 /DNA_START=52 /DNA_END=1029 /DNA_ORIENTATION=+
MAVVAAPPRFAKVISAPEKTVSVLSPRNAPAVVRAIPATEIRVQSAKVLAAPAYYRSAPAQRGSDVRVPGAKASIPLRSIQKSLPAKPAQIVRPKASEESSSQLAKVPVSDSRANTQNEFQQGTISVASDNVRKAQNIQTTTMTSQVASCNGKKQAAEEATDTNSTIDTITGLSGDLPNEVVGDILEATEDIDAQKTIFEGHSEMVEAKKEADEKATEDIDAQKTILEGHGEIVEAKKEGDEKALEDVDVKETMLECKDTVEDVVAEKVIGGLPTEEAVATQDCNELKIREEETLPKLVPVKVAAEPQGNTSCMQGCMSFFRLSQ